MCLLRGTDSVFKFTLCEIPSSNLAKDENNKQAHRTGNAILQAEQLCCLLLLLCDCPLNEDDPMFSIARSAHETANSRYSATGATPPGRAGHRLKGSPTVVWGKALLKVKTNGTLVSFISLVRMCQNARSCSSFFSSTACLWLSLQLAITGSVIMDVLTFILIIEGTKSDEPELTT